MHFANIASTTPLGRKEYAESYDCKLRERESEAQGDGCHGGALMSQELA